jgi:internalin A
VRALFGQDFLATATSLSLSNANLSDRQVARLVRSFPRIESLYIDNIPLGDETARAYASLRGVVNLSLGHTDVSEDLPHNLRGCALLSYVALSSARIDGDALGALSALPAVTSLGMQDCEITDEQLRDLVKMPALKRVALRHCTRIGDDALLYLGQIPKLDSVDIRETGITGAGLKFLGGLRSLQFLNLSGTPLADDALANVSALPVLAMLDVHDTPLTDAALAHLKRMTWLANLNLAGTRVTDDGLAALQAMTGLYWLNLDNTAVSDQALASLSALPKLTQLTIRNARITDAGISSLTGFPALTNLQVRGDHITSAVIKALEAKRPGLIIVAD